MTTGALLPSGRSQTSTRLETTLLQPPHHLLRDIGEERDVPLPTPRNSLPIVHEEKIEIRAEGEFSAAEFSRCDTGESSPSPPAIARAAMS